MRVCEFTRFPMHATNYEDANLSVAKHIHTCMWCVYQTYRHARALDQAHILASGTQTVNFSNALAQPHDRPLVCHII